MTYSINANLFCVAIIELLNKVMTTVTSTEAKDASIIQERPDHSDLWKIKDYKEEDYWFMKVGTYRTRHQLSDLQRRQNLS